MPTRPKLLRLPRPPSRGAKPTPLSRTASRNPSSSESSIQTSVAANDGSRRWRPPPRGGGAATGRVARGRPPAAASRSSVPGRRAPARVAKARLDTWKTSSEKGSARWCLRSPSPLATRQGRARTRAPADQPGHPGSRRRIRALWHLYIGELLVNAVRAGRARSAVAHRGPPLAVGVRRAGARTEQ